MFDRAVLAAVGDAQARGVAPEVFVGAIEADYFAWYNLLGMLLQLFAVSRVLAKWGVRNALLLLPVFAFLAYASAAAVPVLAVIRLVIAIGREHARRAGEGELRLAAEPVPS